MMINWVAVEMMRDIVVSAYGPFEEKEDAFKFSDRYNEDHGEDSPYRVVVRMMTRPV